MHTNNVNPLLLAKLDRRDIPTQLVDLVFDIGKNVVRPQVREDLIDQPSGNGQATMIGNDMEGDIELVEFGLG